MITSTSLTTIIICTIKVYKMEAMETTILNNKVS